MRTFVLALAFASLVSVAHAEPCARRDSAVGLVFGGAWPPGRQGAVVAELRAALEVQDLVLCLENESDEPPIASLHLVAEAADRIRVEVRDRVTAKRVERDLSLGALPEDTRALAIAVAADELLRASWAELVLVDAPAPAIEPPAPVRAMVARERRTVAAQDDARLARFLALVGELRWHGGGALLGGAELRVELGVHPRFAVGLAIGAARAHTEVVTAGSVDAIAVRGGLDAIVGLAGSDTALQLVGVAGIRSGWARFDARAADQTRTAQGSISGATVSARGGLEGRAHFGAFQLRLGAWVGGAFAAIGATADGEAVVGTEGVEVGVSLGVGLRL